MAQTRLQNLISYSKVNVLFTAIYWGVFFVELYLIGRLIPFYTDETSVYEADMVPIVRSGVLVSAITTIGMIVCGEFVRRAQVNKQSKAKEIREEAINLVGPDSVTQLDHWAAYWLGVSGSALVLFLTILILSPSILLIGTSAVGGSILWLSYQNSQVKNALDLKLFVLMHLMHFVYMVGSLVIIGVLLRLAIDILPSILPISEVYGQIMLLNILILMFLLLIILVNLKKEWPRNKVMKQWNDLCASSKTSEVLTKIESLAKSKSIYLHAYGAFFFGLFWLEAEIELGFPSIGVLILSMVGPFIALHFFKYRGIGHLLEPPRISDRPPTKSERSVIAILGSTLILVSMVIFSSVFPHTLLEFILIYLVLTISFLIYLYRIPISSKQ